MDKDLKVPRDYEYIDEIGRGGFGIVIKAKDFWADKVAVKILDSSKIKEINVQRFEREIKIHNMLNHNNIVPILDFNIDESEDVIHYTMPLAAKNLSQELIEYRENNMGNMDDDTAAYYFEQILDAIEYAHKEGVIHRDLKPLNILIFDDGTLKISDFGLGKFINRDTKILTQTRFSLGTECYSAPEQYQEGDARNVDERADIYSLGKILYEIITFSLPVVIDNDKLKDSKFKLLINKATKYDRNKRYGSIKEMRRIFDLLKGGSLSFRNSAREFTELYKGYLQSKDNNIMGKVVDILLENKNDYKLYTENFMELDIDDLQLLHENYNSEFNEIVETYIKHIDSFHIFSFTDSIATFLIKVLKVIEDFDVYEKIIDVLLRLAYNHNRFYVGEELAKYIGLLKDDNVDKLLIISEVFRRNGLEVDWLKPYLSLYEAENILNYV